jgi:DNA mismatch endonuclease Vsr
MQRQARKDTDLEALVRRALYRRGLRYRLQVKLLPRHTADIVFKGPRVVVDVRSCFWHRCPLHGSSPRANSAWWAKKLARTAERDKQVVERLESDGWRVVVVWQHDDIEAAADKIAALVKNNPPMLSPH